MRLFARFTVAGVLAALVLSLAGVASASALPMPKFVLEEGHSFPVRLNESSNSPVTIVTAPGAILRTPITCTGSNVGLEIKNKYTLKLLHFELTGCSYPGGESVRSTGSVGILLSTELEEINEVVRGSTAPFSPAMVLKVKETLLVGDHHNAAIRGSIVVPFAPTNLWTSSLNLPLNQSNGVQEYTGYNGGIGNIKAHLAMRSDHEVNVWAEAALEGNIGLTASQSVFLQS